MLKIISCYHDEWLKIVKSFGAKYPEDLIQDFYLLLVNVPEEKIITNNEPNRAYIWVVLRNMAYNEKVFQYCDLPNNLQADEQEYDFSQDELIERTEQAINDLNEYDRRLLEIYVNEDISGSKLAEATGINKYSIYRTIRKCKKKHVRQS